uniref:Retrotransposon gag domain-containing protein n=1 Tax=Chenopodium quinoa TaxID=63459 RepID=A0A803LN84_CHEQI
MEAHLQALEKRFEAQSLAANQKLEELSLASNWKFKDILHMMQAIKEQMLDCGSSPRYEDRFSQPKLGYTPKLEFPKFDGTNPRLWIKKCCKYFTMCKIPDDYKVDLASLNMVDKAENWVSSYLSSRTLVDWQDFVIDVNGLFKDEIGVNVVEEFNKLQQTGSIETYVDEFENLRAIMLQNSLVFPEKYLLQHESITVNFQKYTKPSSYSAKSYQLVTNTNTFKPPLLPTPNTKPFTTHKSTSKPFLKPKYVPVDVREEKIAKGLCYYCDAPYDRNHVCQFKEPQLFTVEIPGLDEVDAAVVSLEENDDDVLSNPRISLSALSRSQNFHTMRVKAMVYRKPLQTLIDSGSTHNFLDRQLAEELGCKVKRIIDQAVTVADGNHLICDSVCKNFSWTLGGHTFTADVILIALGSCEMVLGVLWLSTLGSISWNFKQLTMKFVIGQNEVELKGVPAQKLKVSENCPSAKLMECASQVCFMQLTRRYQLHFSNSGYPNLWDSPIEIQYRSGKENLVADALSRVQGSHILLLAISVVDSDLASLIKASYSLNDNTQAIIDDLSKGVSSVLGFSLQDALIPEMQEAPSSAIPLPTAILIPELLGLVMSLLSNS